MMIILTLVLILLFVPDQAQSNNNEKEIPYSNQRPSLRRTTDLKGSEYVEIGNNENHYAEISSKDQDHNNFDKDLSNSLISTPKSPSMSIKGITDYTEQFLSKFSIIVRLRINMIFQEMEIVMIHT